MTTSKRPFHRLVLAESYSKAGMKSPLQGVGGLLGGLETKKGKHLRASLANAKIRYLMPFCKCDIKDIDRPPKAATELPRSAGHSPKGWPGSAERPSETTVTTPAVVPARLIADGETLLMVGRLLQFVDHSHGIVLHGDVAVALGIDDEVVFAQAELAGAFAISIESAGR